MYAAAAVLLAGGIIAQAAPAQAATIPTVIGSVQVGPADSFFPWGVAVSRDGTHAYVTNENPTAGGVSVIDTGTDTVTTTIATSQGAFGAAVSPDGSHLAVATNDGAGDHAVDFIDTATNTVTATVSVDQDGSTSASAVAYSPDGTRLYVLVQGDPFGNPDNGIYVIDTATDSLTGFYEDDNLANDTPGDGGIVVSPDGSRVYVTDSGFGSIDVFSTVTGTEVASVPDVGGFPEGIALSPDGSTAYVANFEGSSLSVLNTATNTITATISGLNSNPFAVAVSPDGSTVYASSFTGLYVIDTATNTVAGNVTASGGYTGVAFNPAGTRAYVVQTDSNTVLVLNSAEPAPAVTGLSPSHGPLAGGTTVTITGTGFAGATAVTFGSKAAASFTVNSGTSITATTPAAASVGPVDVTVTTPAGTSATTAADQFSYIYPFSGFLSPVDSPPTINMVHAGQAIPIKFQLGGNQGLNILAPGYPTVQQVTCGTNVPINTATETDTAGGSGLQYDSGSGTYTYVWKTSKAFKGTCQVFTLGLADGTFYTANFQYS